MLLSVKICWFKFCLYSKPKVRPCARIEQIEMLTWRINCSGRLPSTISAMHAFHCSERLLQPDCESWATAAAVNENRVWTCSKGERESFLIAVELFFSNFWKRRDLLHHVSSNSFLLPVGPNLSGYSSWLSYLRIPGLFLREYLIILLVVWLLSWFAWFTHWIFFSARSRLLGRICLFIQEIWMGRIMVKNNNRRNSKVKKKRCGLALSEKKHWSTTSWKYRKFWNTEKLEPKFRNYSDQVYKIQLV